MSAFPEGNAVVYCEGAFNTPNGKTAHGLLRFTRRYRVLSVVDSNHAGRDAGEVLDGRVAGVPILASVAEAVKAAESAGVPATHVVVGLAPDGGRLPTGARAEMKRALELGLNLDSGLHDFLSEDPELAAIAKEKGLTIRDVRLSPSRDRLHFFSGKIGEVESLKVALLGTDSAVGKRTTAWRVVFALEDAGLRAEMVGTGQTAWMQGVEHGIILDTLVNDFLSGEIEHAVWSAWDSNRPDVIVIEGQGSLLNPAYPGGYEILAAGRPDVVILQHAPGRRDYDGFPGFPIQPLSHQIRVMEMVSGKPVVAVTVSHEGLSPEQAREACVRIEGETGLPAVDVLLDGAGRIAEILKIRLAERPGQQGVASHE